MGKPSRILRAKMITVVQLSSSNSLIFLLVCCGGTAHCSALSRPLRQGPWWLRNVPLPNLNVRSLNPFSNISKCQSVPICNCLFLPYQKLIFHHLIKKKSQYTCACSSVYVCVHSRYVSGRGLTWLLNSKACSHAPLQFLLYSFCFALCTLSSHSFNSYLHSYTLNPTEDIMTNTLHTPSFV